MTLPLADIQTPTLLLDRRRAQANIDRMIERAARSGVRFRPHFKTHQSAQIGAWFRDRGVTAITVSSVEMAVYFADHGWDDITIAFPANLRQLAAIEALAGRVKLHLLVEAVEVVEALAGRLTQPVDLWLKIDVGYHRTGLLWNETEPIVAVAQAIAAAPILQLRGLLTHAGHTYAARSVDEVEAIYRETVTRLQGVRAALERAGLGPVQISIGDTPSCSLVADLSEVDEIRPGNFVFYDLMQLQLGACQESDLAVAVACPVVARHPRRNQLVIYGGAVHLSKEALQADEESIFGYVAPLSAQGWGARLPQTYLRSLSQEHGVIQTTPQLLDRFQVGDLLAVLPVHSCLTANLLRRYVTLEGEIYAAA